MVKTKTAYLLWCFSFFSLAGIHRFYLGKPVSGCLYLGTLGFFGIGQFIDLFLIPGMVREQNLLHSSTDEAVSMPSTVPNQRLDVRILSVCREFKGATVSDCVIETHTDPATVKEMIQKLCLEGLLLVDNREKDGAVIYKAI